MTGAKTCFSSAEAAVVLMQMARAAAQRFKMDFPNHIQDILEVEHDIQTALGELLAQAQARKKQRQQRQVCAHLPAHL